MSSDGDAYLLPKYSHMIVSLLLNRAKHENEKENDSTSLKRS